MITTKARKKKNTKEKFRALREFSCLRGKNI